ncbi:uncharacterized protein LOC132194670 isoform X2 [Neocloeon triangulifer]|uniref:uncharacterized protein LOC132194670 isoform X2 n=1 Tax=Neocloeon triangulifer TaxID=2078957 RepID=UPI00286F80C5|nr:uncharacterized protein LOC132194670 isoform X2 [Neocloeon triangulifer]
MSRNLRSNAKKSVAEIERADTPDSPEPEDNKEQTELLASKLSYDPGWYHLSREERAKLLCRKIFCIDYGEANDYQKKLLRTVDILKMENILSLEKTAMPLHIMLGVGRLFFRMDFWELSEEQKHDLEEWMLKGSKGDPVKHLNTLTEAGENWLASVEEAKLKSLRRQPNLALAKKFFSVKYLQLSELECDAINDFKQNITRRLDEIEKIKEEKAAEAAKEEEVVITYCQLEPVKIKQEKPDDFEIAIKQEPEDSDDDIELHRTVVLRVEEVTKEVKMIQLAEDLPLPPDQQEDEPVPETTKSKNDQPPPKATEESQYAQKSGKSAEENMEITETEVFQNVEKDNASSEKAANESHKEDPKETKPVDSQPAPKTPTKIDDHNDALSEKSCAKSVDADKFPKGSEAGKSSEQQSSSSHQDNNSEIKRTAKVAKKRVMSPENMETSSKKDRFDEEVPENPSTTSVKSSQIKKNKKQLRQDKYRQRHISKNSDASSSRSAGDFEEEANMNEQANMQNEPIHRANLLYKMKVWKTFEDLLWVQMDILVDILRIKAEQNQDMSPTSISMYNAIKNSHQIPGIEFEINWIVAAKKLSDDEKEAKHILDMMRKVAKKFMVVLALYEHEQDLKTRPSSCDVRATVQADKVISVEKILKCGKFSLVWQTVTEAAIIPVLNKESRFIFQRNYKTLIRTCKAKVLEQFLMCVPHALHLSSDDVAFLLFRKPANALNAHAGVCVQIMHLSFCACFVRNKNCSWKLPSVKLTVGEKLKFCCMNSITNQQVYIILSKILPFLSDEQRMVFNTSMTALKARLIHITTTRKMYKSLTDDRYFQKLAQFKGDAHQMKKLEKELEKIKSDKSKPETVEKGSPSSEKSTSQLIELEMLRLRTLILQQELDKLNCEKEKETPIEESGCEEFSIPSQGQEKQNEQEVEMQVQVEEEVSKSAETAKDAGPPKEVGNEQGQDDKMQVEEEISKSVETAEDAGPPKVEGNEQGQDDQMQVEEEISKSTDMSEDVSLPKEAILVEEAAKIPEVSAEPSINFPAHNVCTAEPKDLSEGECSSSDEEESKKDEGEELEEGELRENQRKSEEEHTELKRLQKKVHRMRRQVAINALLLEPHKLDEVADILLSKTFAELAGSERRRVMKFALKFNFEAAQRAALERLSPEPCASPPIFHTPIQHSEQAAGSAGNAAPLQSPSVSSNLQLEARAEKAPAKETPMDAEPTPLMDKPTALIPPNRSSASAEGQYEGDLLEKQESLMPKIVTNIRICQRCHLQGHTISYCRYRTCAGIPKSDLVPCNADSPGAMVSPSGFVRMKIYEEFENPKEKVEKSPPTFVSSFQPVANICESESPPHKPEEKDVETKSEDEIETIKVVKELENINEVPCTLKPESDERAPLVNKIKASILSVFLKKKGADRLWSKFTIKNCRDHSEEFLLNATLSALSHKVNSFVPVWFHRVQNDAAFFVKNASDAILHFLDHNLIVNVQEKSLQLNLEIEIGTKDSKLTPFPVNDLIFEAIRRRIKAGNVDLSSFHQHPDLARYCFFPLNRQNNLVKVLRLIMFFESSTLTTVSLADNDLDDLNLIFSIKEPVFASVTKVDARNNKITKRSMAAMSRIMSGPETFNVKELHLDGNPICSEFSSPKGYVEFVTGVFPSLEVLDGCKLSEKLLYYFCDPNSKAFAEQFTRQYFSIFDSDRRDLLRGLYHEEALFSLTSTVLQSQSTTTSANLDKYLDCSRNMKKFSDLEKINKLLVVGNSRVVQYMKTFPATEHDDASFTVDVTLFTPRHVKLAVSGLFKESQREDTSPRHFYRVFVLKQVGDSFVISNEMLFVTNCTTEQNKREASSKNRPPSDSSLDLFMNTKSKERDLTEAEKDRMANKLSEVTEMKKEWSKKCLADVDWDFRNALIYFQRLYEEQQVPGEAFTNMTLTDSSTSTAD